MTDDSALLGKIFVGAFILELIGVIFAITMANTAVGAGAFSTDSFNFFNDAVNGTTRNIVNSFSSCSFSKLTCDSPLHQMEYSQAWFISSVQNAIIWIGNALITLIDIIVNGLWIGINLMALVLLMIGLFGFIFVVFLPLILVAAGPVGYILTLGYVFIISLAGYKYGHIILDLIGMALRAFGVLK